MDAGLALSRLKPGFESPLFTRDDGEPWTNNYWARELRKTITAVNAEAKGKDRIPVGASAYSFRHARISEPVADPRRRSADHGPADRDVGCDD
jgi:hypothetical protein